MTIETSTVVAKEQPEQIKEKKKISFNKRQLDNKHANIRFL